MERLNDARPVGIRADALRVWGLVFLAAGIFGKSVLQNRVLGLDHVDSRQLLELLESNMTAATFALALQTAETCAVPIFALLLVEGYGHTGHFRSYFLRVLGLAVLTELPYNLAMGGKILDFGSRNPVFALAVGLLVLYFFERYPDRNAKNVFVKIIVTLAALIWPGMLRIDHGFCTVLMVLVLWLFRRNPLKRNLAGAGAAILCTLVSPFYLTAPMAFLAIHFYNGEKTDSKSRVHYFAYPALLLLFGIAAKFV